MAKTTSRKTNLSKTGSSSKVEWKFPLDKTDFKWLLIGAATVALGHLLLATGITDEPAVENGTWNNIFVIHVAPIVLALGYVVIIPMALFKVFSRRKKAKAAKTIQQ